MIKLNCLFIYSRNVIPENLFQSTFSQTQTKYKVDKNIIERNTTNGTIEVTERKVTKYLGEMGNPNIIGTTEIPFCQ